MVWGFRIVQVKEEGRIKLLWGTRKADKLVYFKNRVQEFGTEYGWGGSKIQIISYGFPSNENELSSKFQYDIIRPTITLTSMYLQLALSMKAQEKSPWMDRRKISQKIR